MDDETWTTAVKEAAQLHEDNKLAEAEQSWRQLAADYSTPDLDRSVT
jgi:hypothetical protein